MLLAILGLFCSGLPYSDSWGYLSLFIAFKPNYTFVVFSRRRSDIIGSCSNRVVLPAGTISNFYPAFSSYLALMPIKKFSKFA